MAFKLSTAARNFMLSTGFKTMFDSGLIEIRNGTRPADADTAPTGTVLASVVLPSTCLGAPSAGTCSKSGTWEDTSADASGTATWFRMRQATDAGTTNTTDERLDGDVGTSGSDLNLDNTVIAVTQQVTITAATFTQPAT